MNNNKLTQAEIKKFQVFGIKIVIVIILIFSFFPFSIFIFFVAHKNLKKYFINEWEKSGLKNIVKQYNKNIENQNNYGSERGNTNNQEAATGYSQEMLKNTIENNQRAKEELESKKRYENNQKTLQEKMTQSVKRKKGSIEKPSWKDSVSRDKKTHKNFFGNSKKSDTFGSGKSIWDNYESVTDKFSSNKK